MILMISTDSKTLCVKSPKETSVACICPHMIISVLISSSSVAFVPSSRLFWHLSCPVLPFPLVSCNQILIKTKQIIGSELMGDLCSVSGPELSFSYWMSIINPEHMAKHMQPKQIAATNIARSQHCHNRDHLVDLATLAAALHLRRSLNLRYRA